MLWTDCSYSLGTLHSVEINDGATRRGSWGKAPRKSFEDKPSTLP